VYVNGVKVTDKVKLTALSSNMVRKIEVIRAPGAEYPSGTTSVIRITTSVPLKDIVNLNLIDQANQGHRFSNSLTANTFGTFGKFDLLASLGYKFGNSRQSAFATEKVSGKDGNVIRENDTYQKDFIHSSGWNWLAGATWHVSSNDDIQLEYSGRSSSTNRDFLSELTTRKEDDQVVTDYLSKNEAKPTAHSLLGSYTHDFGGSSLEIFATYNYRKSNADENIFLLPEYDLAQVNLTKTTSEMWTAQGQYSWKFRKKDKQNVGIYGGKSNRTSDNEFSVTGLQNVRSSVEWGEFFYSGYWEFKGYGITPGLRGRWERQQSHSNISSEITDFSKTYFNVVPNLSIYHRFSKKLAVNLYYKYSYYLPSFSEISPSVSLNNLIYYETGNPDLKIPRTHEIAMVFNLPKITIIGEFKKNNNTISSITSPIEGTEYFLVKPMNMSGNYDLSLKLSYNLNFANKLRLYANGSLSYDHVKYYYLDELQKRDRMTAMIWLNGNYSLTKNFSLFMTGYYTSPQLVQNTRVGYNCNISLGANLRLLKSKLTLRLAANDLLARSVTPWWTEYSPNLYRTRRNYYDTRRVSLTATYRFTFVRQNYSELDNADDFDRM
ncbi:MAG: outer membrane beta-barrel family protein, partial [Muribaculaceae bacterium]|nr:outer membrane beta-barrel family protein [Muribaculaceae bacterium]